MTNSADKPTRWDALKAILLSPERRKTIGTCWPLYFHLIYHLDSKNELQVSMNQLSRDLDESASTIKKWKEQLIKKRVVSNRQTKHGIILSLLPPYDSPATALKDDVVELRLRSDSKTRNMLKMALGSNYMVLLPIIADLAQRVERLEGNPKASSLTIAF